MTELTHHDADDSFREIQLSGKQLVALFMGATLLAVVIFLCGVQVGRNARRPHADESADATLPPAAAAVPGVQSSAAASGPPAVEPPPPAGEGDDHLTYAKRLQSETPPPEKLKPRTEAGPAPSAPAKSAESPKPATTAKNAPASSAGLGAARPGIWVVQLVALKDRGAAMSVVQRLAAKGYPAFVVGPSAGAPSIYRVQVGRYNDRHEAEQVARRLEKEEQFKPWISH